MGESYDVVIAGGAVMGSSLAFWLTELAPGKLKILVIERDRSYARSSTALSVASIRQQFSNPINVRISRFGIDFVRNVKDWLGQDGGVADLGFHEGGYLFLAGTPTQARAMAEVAEIQRAEGAGTLLLAPEALAERFPWLDLAGVALGSFGPRDEGWFDNMGLLGGFRRAARARGVDYLDDEVTGLVREGDRITAVALASGRRVACGHAVNACGTRAAALLRSLGEDLPVEPRKRTVFLIDAPNAQAPGAPLLVDHTGFYLRPEGRHWIAATVPERDGPADPDDFDPNLDEFEDLVWPRLYARAPGFDAVKVIRAWAGHYAYNRLDQNAVLGRWPGTGNLYLMNGFSGHGLQQAPAVGRGIAELIIHGGYRTLDLSPLGPERILTGTPFLERAIV
ncbi:MAG: FAD-binding oxidoreductase [Paracoccaceae bacterium]|nr:FAD-binding oxidoreductase [Paracoccaceae bacterium]